jgi:hypothetical protein
MSILLKIIVFIFCLNQNGWAGWLTVKQDAYNKLENTINTNLNNTEVTITSTERSKPEFEILTVQPLAEQDNNITFFQGSAIRSDGDRETVNLGLGHRIFLNDDLTMLGINGFYDHELDYDHKRTSIGAELRTSAYEFNTNSYFASSNSRTGKSNNTEESIDGFDFEVGGHLPYIPNWKVFAKHFEFEVPNGNDYKGLEYSSEIYIPGKGVKLTSGFTDTKFNDDNWFFQISFNLGTVNSNSKFVRDTAYNLTSMKDKKLDKVRRENKIIKAITTTSNCDGLCFKVKGSV